MSELSTKVAQSVFMSSKGTNLLKGMFCNFFRMVTRSKIVNTDRKRETDLFYLLIMTINFYILIANDY
ncbi:hypothetical protein CWM66_07910 [Kosakonia sp. H7A]|nr:hypothetical protein CWM66_07910 [Kosakonia sp. H7A]